MAFTSSGSQEEVKTAVTLLLLDKIPVAQEQLVVEVSEAGASQDSGRRLTTTDWQVDYTVMVANYSAAMAMADIVEDMASSSAAVVQDLSDILASYGLDFDGESYVITGSSVVEMGASATHSSTSTATSSSSTATVTTATSATSTHTTTSLPFVVRQTISFASTGTQDELLVVVTDLLLTKLEVEEDLLTVELSDSGAWQGSGRRLSSTMWTADFQVRAADHEAASSILEVTEDIHGAAVVFALEMRAWFAGHGLQLESGSVTVAEPRLMEASELYAPTGAPTAAPSGSPAGPSITLAPVSLEEEDEKEANVTIFAIVVGGVGLSLIVCCVLTEVYVLRRRRARQRVLVNGINAQISALMGLEGPPADGTGDAEEGNDNNKPPSPSGEASTPTPPDDSPHGSTEDSGGSGGGDSVNLYIKLAKKTPVEKSGATLRNDGVSLEISELQDDGFLREWNRMHPGREVQVGDRIVSVNGISGSCSRMRREFQLSPKLDMTIHRASSNQVSNVVEEDTSLYSKLRLQMGYDTPRREPTHPSGGIFTARSVASI